MEFVVCVKNNTIICHKKKILEMLVLVWLIHRKKTLIFFVFFLERDTQNQWADKLISMRSCSQCFPRSLLTSIDT